MAPSVGYSGLDQTAGIQGDVFAGKKFFIVQRVPQRQHYVNLVESNGGRMVKLEAQADFLIADHLRPDAPPASLSYKFIEEATKQGVTPEDATPFLIRRSKSAATSSTAAPAANKFTRTPFTANDDKLLYAWVIKASQNGLALKGNDLYKTLAHHNSRHTYQSWRDRYVKILSLKPPVGWESFPKEDLPSLSVKTLSTSVQHDTASVYSPPPTPAAPVKTPPVKPPRFKLPPGAAAAVESEKTAAPQTTAPRAPATSKVRANTQAVRSHNSGPQTLPPQTQAPPSQPAPSPVNAESLLYDRADFTKSDFNNLLQIAHDIQNVCVGRYQESWIAFASECPEHTAVEWRFYYENEVLPKFLQGQDNPELFRTKGDPAWAKFWGNQGQPINLTPYKEYQPTVQEADPLIATVDAEKDMTTRAPTIQTHGKSNAIIDSTEAVKIRKSDPASSSKRKSIEDTAYLDETHKRRRISPPAQIPSSDSLVQQTESNDDVSAQLLREMAELRDVRHKLTRDNLARVQAEQGLPEGDRGKDLAKDHENDDQAGYANFLLNILPANLKEKALEEVQAPEIQAEEQDPLQQAGDDEADEEDDDDKDIDPDLMAITAEKRLSTQQIYEAETQQFDADMPSPPEIIQETLFVNADSQILADDDVWPFIDAQIDRGFSEERVVAALHQTSMNPKLAVKVLDSRGGRVNLAGVWTQEEDEIVEGGDASAMREVEEKHGDGAVMQRLKFLEDWREDLQKAEDEIDDP
jgi:hypothetical protein